MKQVWSVAVLVAFLILEGRVEYANYLAVASGGADMAFGWHAAWLAINASIALVAGTVLAMVVDTFGDAADELAQRLAPTSIDLRK
jgi:hypothetical protein